MTDSPPAGQSQADQSGAGPFPSETEFRQVVGALRQGQDRLAALASWFGPADLAGPSYCADWDMAQVLGHLGSGAEIFGLFVDAGLGLADPPAGPQDMTPIWARWDAMAAEDRPGAAVAANAELTGRLEKLSADEVARFSVSFFGHPFDAAGLARARLSELTFHTWDLEAPGDPSAELPTGAVALLLVQLSGLGGRAGRPGGEAAQVAVSTRDPDGRYRLTLGPEAVELAEGPAPDAESQLELPAAALLRLVAGRLDSDHTPAGVSVSGPVGLDRLRDTFPGF